MVCDLNFSISLGEGRGGVVVFDPQLWTKILEGVIVELFSFVLDQDPRDPILADDMPPDEASHVLLCNGCQSFSFYPLYEVIYAYYKELQLLHRYWEWSHDV